ncbi:RluA family pseudouridine synthase [Croceicoccus sp. YJ47]|uniref:RluA family pseudouridine synthase n=1 Tax=Croceicoccus sp. YJ47 TaxID=2798724 RepID=UPI0019221005|nr:RNA pseudouridine synthase [Croceicoccus sp. YJ47]QQN73025.1 RNA pseudouridine synthase [Croceicoccus sp. YJ47]
MTDIPILFEDAEALIIDKPAGLPVDRPRNGAPSLADRLGALTLGFAREPVPVHRLDTDTSGCLLLARNPKALKRLSRAFEERLVEKTYLGIVSTELAEAEGEIALSLSKVSSEKDGWRMIAAKKGKPALTRWRRIAVRGGLSLVEFRPETGRTHQIRIHAQHGLGAALLGDPVYGRPDARARRTMLHAAALCVPRDNKPALAARAPFPRAFADLGFDDPGPAPRVEARREAE